MQGIYSKHGLLSRTEKVPAKTSACDLHAAKLAEFVGNPPRRCPPLTIAAKFCAEIFPDPPEGISLNRTKALAFQSLMAACQGGHIICALIGRSF